ncbi:MAG: peroxidase-related enzyme [Proteobacteria bacterium]|nr:peroxidase-related enzyme [Pseudomonadota bacterium]
MTALRLDSAPLSTEMSEYFKKCEEKIGFVPNVLIAYSHSMAKLETFAAFYNELMLAPSGLSKLEREMIGVVVSAENRCFYCLVAHGAALRSLSGKPELGEAIAFNYRMAEIEPRQRAMLDFALKVSRASAEITEADREKLREAGFNDADIWDIAATASFYAMSNRMASATGMSPNPEYHGQARG